MKLTTLIIIFLYISYVFTTCPTDGTTCTANSCCASTEASAGTCTTLMKSSAGVYEKAWTASGNTACSAFTATAGSCVKSDKTYAAATAGSECVDANNQCQDMGASPFTQGYVTEAGKVCKALVARTSCVDSATKVWTDLKDQTVATASPKCVLDNGVCQALFSSGTTFGYGWKAAGDFTCVKVVTTDTAPLCVDPLTNIASSVLTTGTKVCALATDNSCQPLTYQNGAVRYTLVASKFTCAPTTTAELLCNNAVCAPTHCCVGGTTCTKAQDTTKNCLTSSSSITCLAQATAQYYYNALDASCVDPTTLTTNKVYCIDGTNKVLKTLVAADNKCINTDKTCTATTTTLTTTAADDFNCKTVTATTTTTTTTSGNIIYLVGTFLILVSTILI